VSNMSPSFSIIIPVYNVAPYLRECLDSVLAQTFTDWEAICVDDGSTDGSGTIIDEYAARDKRFKVIHQKNAGVSAARNRALDEATGEWIGFLDADDVWVKEWLDRIVAGIDDGVDWIRTGWKDWDEDTDVKVERHSEINKYGSSVFADNLISVGWRLVSECGFPFVNFFKQLSVGRRRFQCGVRIREDALFCFEMILNVHKLKIVDSTGYLRRERSGSAFFSPRLRSDTINLLASYIELWNRKKPSMGVDTISASVVQASTLWVRKDVRQWFELCADRTLCDELKVWRRVRKLLKFGAISRNIPGTRFDRLRWRIYLSTGWGRILLVNRLNLLGRQIKVEKT